MPPSASAFVVMPFGRKPDPSGIEIDFDRVYNELLAPAISDAGLQPRRADADRRAGSIHADMFQELLLAEYVVADLTLDNANVWYELGVRHALRASGTLLTFALRDRLPFDIVGQRAVHYTLAGGQLDPEKLRAERESITAAIKATADAGRGRRASPVYEQLPNLQEPEWKRLRVGSVNEFWQGLQSWEERLQVAVGKQRPGDILALAEETPNQALRFEALRSAARALVKLNRARYALNVLEQARKIDPDDVECRQLEAMALGRELRFDEARVALRRLADERKHDGETLGLLARTVQDEWKRLWAGRKDQPGSSPVAAAKETAAALRQAADAYASAFRVDPSDYRTGINAVTLGRLWEHVTGQWAEVDMDVIEDGVRWALESALGSHKDYWALFGRAELALNEDRAQDAIRDYEAAAQLAVQERHRFALDSCAQQLAFLGELGFRPLIVAEAATVIERAEKQLGDLAASDAGLSQPERVVLFTGQMMDDLKALRPDQKPRFPAEEAKRAGEQLVAALVAVGAKAGDLGICGGACGGDLLFAEACLKLKMRVELRLALRRPEFRQKAVEYSDPEHTWQQLFDWVVAQPGTQVLVMPDELGPPPAGVEAHERCNRWMLYSVLSQDLANVSYLAMWDGQPEAGGEHTANMVEQVRKHTGYEPTVIPPGPRAEPSLVDKFKNVISLPLSLVA